MELRTDRFKFKELFPEKAKKYAQKLHVKADEIEFVRKGIPIDPKDIEIKEGERAAIRYVTTPHLDRDSEILIPTGAMLDDFRQSPSVLYAHDYKGLPVGKDLWIKPTAKGILAKTQYAKHQFAEDVYQCVRGKFLNSNSVGFIPVESVKPDDKKAFAELQETLEKDFEIPKKESGKAKNIYTKWIMLEHSDVPVASNAQSLNLAVSKGDLPIQSERLRKDLEIEVVKDKKDREIEVEMESILKPHSAYVQSKIAEEKHKEAVEILTGDKEIVVEKDEKKEKQLEDYEYLLHHIETDDEGKENVHHCYVYDHIANLFEQEHLVVADGKVHLGGKEIKDGIFHVINGLEPTQEVAWGNAEAEKAGITPKKMKAGMTLKKKSKEW